MSADASILPTSPVASGNPNAAALVRRIAKRQPLSCRPCRQHKLRCDRQVPCGTCIRYHREVHCRQNPAPHRRQQQRAAAPRNGSPSHQQRRHSPIDAAQTTGVAVVQNGRLSPSNEAVELHSIRQTVESIYMATAARQVQLTNRRGPWAIDDHSSWATVVGGLNGGDPDPVPLPYLLSVLYRAGNDGSSLWTMLNPQTRQGFWRHQLLAMLPTRSQCDILLTYYVEHVNWLFQTVHVPSFRSEYARFWDGGVTGCDLIWISLLFTIISLSALYIPSEATEIVGLPRDTIRNLAHGWHLASQRALQAGEYDARPCLRQLQTFSVTQLYWYATNDIEILNSRLGQAVRNAQALNLDKDTDPSRCLQDEMRHRMWWDLVDSDTFQAVCLDRPPLIRLRFPGVPLPLNCNDIDITDTAVRPRRLDEPTEMSMNIFRAQIFQLLNQHLCSWDEPHLRTYDRVVQLDTDILQVMNGVPLYFQLNDHREPPRVCAGYEFLTWQNHILRTCVSTQRIRMYRPFLSTKESESWSRCAGAAEDALAVYRTLRNDPSPSSRQKFFAQAYQVFSVAVTVAALLLVDGDLPILNASQQIEDMTSDLKMLDEQGCPVLIATQGRRVLLKMLSMYKEGEASSPVDAQRLVPDISIILGGEQVTREYMERLTTQRIVSDPTPSSSVPPSQMREQREAVDETLLGSTGLFLGSMLDDMPDFDPEIFPDALTSGLLNWDMSGLLSSTLDV